MVIGAFSGLDDGLSGRRSVGRGRGGDGGGDALWPSPRGADCALWPVAACGRAGGDASGDLGRSFAYRLALPEVTSPPKIEPFAVIAVSCRTFLLIGPALFQQTALTYLAFVLIAVVGLVLPRRPAVRAAGENPAAVEAQGLSVTGLRSAHLYRRGGGGVGPDGGRRRVPDPVSNFSFFFDMVNQAGLDLHRAGGVRRLLKRRS